MAMKHLGTISSRLIAAGRSPMEPAAIVSKATTADQRVLVSTLAEIAGAAAAAAIEAPAIVAIGEVVRLREALDWLGSESKALGTDEAAAKVRRKTG
jgi:uroporphyrin-III C-methyltransferase